MNTKEYIKRYALFISGLFFIALGIAYTKTARLGVSPVSAIANVLSLKFTTVSIGKWLILNNCILITGQILLLRKNFKPIQLLQLPLSLLFGAFTDIGMKIAALITVDSYLIQLSYVLIGVMLLSVGITLSVIADVIMNSAEAFVKALSVTSKKNFGDIKVGFDITYVLLSVILSLILFGRIEGTREGTLIAAVGTGFIVKFLKNIFTRPLNRFLSDKKQEVPLNK